MTRTSVIIPVHSGADLAAETIRSVLAQEDVDFECLVIDDGSDEGTTGILRGFVDKRIRLLTLPRRSGVAAARNAALAEVKGEYVAFIDAGDILLPGALAAMLASSSGNDIVVASYLLDITEDLQAIDAMGEEPFTGNILELSAGEGNFQHDSLPALLNALLDNDLFHPVSNKLYRRKSLETIIFDNTVFNMLEDELFNLAVFGKVRNVALIRYPVARVNTTCPGSLSMSYDNDRVLNLKKLAEGYERLLAILGCMDDTEFASNCDRQLMFHYIAFLANLKKARTFAHPTAMMYEAEEVLNDRIFSGIVTRLNLRREMLVSTMNVVTDVILPLLRRRSFIFSEHGNSIERMSDILAAVRFHQPDRAEALIEPAIEAVARREDAMILGTRLWSEFHV